SCDCYIRIAHPTRGVVNTHATSVDGMGAVLTTIEMIALHLALYERDGHKVFWLDERMGTGFEIVGLYSGEARLKPLRAPLPPTPIDLNEIGSERILMSSDVQ